MKKYIFLAVAAAMACTASAQNNGQLHFVGADGQSRMVKASEIEKITYTGDDTNGFTHMKITVKGSDPQNIALDGVANCEFRGVGLPDTDLHLVAPTSDPMKFLTGGIWKVVDFGSLYGTTDIPYNWVHDCCKDDRLIFLENGTMGINMGATNAIYTEVKPATETTFMPDGDETFNLGYNEEGKLSIKLNGGAFPIAKLDWINKANDLTYELRDLTATTARFCAPLSANDGGLGYVLLTRESLPVADETFKLLTAHPWKAQDVGWGDGWYGGCTQFKEEVMTLGADGSFIITGDGVTYDDNGKDKDGKYYYNMTGNERWTLIDVDGVKKLSFFCGAFPIALGGKAAACFTQNVAVTSITETECILTNGDGYHIKLIPAE